MNDFNRSLLPSDSINATVQIQHSHVSIDRYTGEKIFRTGPAGPRYRLHLCSALKSVSYFNKHKTRRQFQNNTVLLILYSKLY